MAPLKSRRLELQLHHTIIRFFLIWYTHTPLYIQVKNKTNSVCNRIQQYCDWIKFWSVCEALPIFPAFFFNDTKTKIDVDFAVNTQGLPDDV